MFSTRATPGQGCNCLQRTRRTSCLFHISFKKNSLHCSLLLFRRKKMAPLCRKCPSRSRQTAALSRGGLRLQNKSKLLNYFGVYFTSGAAPPFLSATRWGHTQSSSGICSANALSENLGNGKDTHARYGLSTFRDFLPGKNTSPVGVATGEVKIFEKIKFNSLVGCFNVVRRGIFLLPGSPI